MNISDFRLKLLQNTWICSATNLTANPCRIYAEATLNERLILVHRRCDWPKIFSLPIWSSHLSKDVNDPQSKQLSFVWNTLCVSVFCLWHNVSCHINGNDYSNEDRLQGKRSTETNIGIFWQQFMEDNRDGHSIIYFIFHSSNRARNRNVACQKKAHKMVRKKTDSNKVPFSV